MGGWSDIEVSGHRCCVYQPDAPSPHGYVVVYLHGIHGGRLEDHDAYTQQFERFGLRVIGPVTGPSWWADRIFPAFDPRRTPQQYVLEAVVPYCRQAWEAVPPRIGLFGTSMGGQGALRIAFQYPDTFPVVAALAPAIDFQSRWEEGDPTLRAWYPDAEAARQDTATLHIHPLHWPRHMFFACDPTDLRWHPSSDRLHMKLAALGIPHEADLTTEAGGHGFPYYDAMAEPVVTFLADRLERERLRIV